MRGNGWAYASFRIPHCIGERVDQQSEESSLESTHSDQTDSSSKEPEQESGNHVNSPTKNWLHWMMGLPVFSKSLIVGGSHWMKNIVQKILLMEWLFRMKNLLYKDSSIKDEKLENSEQGELVNSDQEEMENSEHVSHYTCMFNVYFEMFSRRLSTGNYNCMFTSISR